MRATANANGLHLLPARVFIVRVVRVVSVVIVVFTVATRVPGSSTLCLLSCARSVVYRCAQC